MFKKFIIRRLLSFKYAFSGLFLVIREEFNFKIHLLAVLITTAFGIIYNISAVEWLFIVMVTGFVLTAELFNSAVERIADFVSPEMDSRIGHIKDICAAVVLMSAVVAIIVGLIIFVPKF
jgi:diacylglycerol kinase